MGGLKPDHKTIANFRRNSKKALKEVLRQCFKLYIKLDLVEGNTLFLTARSKIKPVKKILKNLRKHKEEILNWFRVKELLSIGIVEGFNGKSKLTIIKFGMCQ